MNTKGIPIPYKLAISCKVPLSCTVKSLTSAPKYNAIQRHPFQSLRYPSKYRPASIIDRSRISGHFPRYLFKM